MYLEFCRLVIARGLEGQFTAYAGAARGTGGTFGVAYEQ